MDVMRVEGIGLDGAKEEGLWEGLPAKSQHSKNSEKRKSGLSPELSLLRLLHSGVGVGVEMK